MSNRREHVGPVGNARRRPPASTRRRYRRQPDSGRRICSPNPATNSDAASTDRASACTHRCVTPTSANSSARSTNRITERESATSTDGGLHLDRDLRRVPAGTKQFVPQTSHGATQVVDARHRCRPNGGGHLLGADDRAPSLPRGHHPPDRRATVPTDPQRWMRLLHRTVQTHLPRPAETVAGHRRGRRHPDTAQGVDRFVEQCGAIVEVHAQCREPRPRVSRPRPDDQTSPGEQIHGRQRLGSEIRVAEGQHVEVGHQLQRRGGRRRVRQRDRRFEAVVPAGLEPLRGRCRMIGETQRFETMILCVPADPGERGALAKAGCRTRDIAGILQSELHFGRERVTARR